jgi:hypothetical protein
MHFPFADLRANGPIDFHPLSPDHPHPAPVYLTDTESGGEDHCQLDLRSVGSCPRQPVEWLWPGKIPIGKVTLLVGDPGLGKSLVALDVAARVSSGSAWPDSSPGGTPGASGDGRGVCAANAPDPATPFTPLRDVPPKIGSVILLTTDDDVGDTIRPRLEAHGANVDRVFFLPAVADLRHDFGQLEAALNRLPDCRLIVVDPVNAYVGPSDSHFHTIVRKVLAPLAELAAKKRVAILAVTHLRKRDGTAIQGATGSMGFVAAARSVWTICRDQNDSRRTLFLPVKNNLGPLGSGLAYTIESHDTLDAPVLRWEADPVTTTVEEAFKPPAKTRGPDPEDRRLAGEWLKLALADGPQASWLVVRQGKQHGFHARTLQRALHDIGAQTSKVAFAGGWEWSLAKESGPADASNGQGVQPRAETGAEKPVAFGETGRLREKSEKNTRGEHPPADLPTPDLASLAAEPSIDESIRFLNRLDAQRNDTQRKKSRPPASSIQHPASST